MLDLDNFKYYNDTLGHHVGDELIVRMARVLQERLRETDVLARLGGDEFAVILPKEDAQGRAAGRRRPARVHPRGGPPVDAGRGKAITASIGIALFDDEERLTGEDVLVNADLAMYDAKEAGRDRISLYHTEANAQARMKGRIKWVDQIRTALDEDGFTLLAQPITDLSGGPCDRYELLLRMHGAGRRPDPARHLPLHSRAPGMGQRDRPLGVTPRDPDPGRAADLGRDIDLEVNLSGLSIGDDSCSSARRERDLSRTGIDPSRLTFEITETAAVANIAKARAFAERLSELGCKFALDDFGAGFGSFYYLKHLPFDFLKIDGEFVKGCASSKTDRLLIEAVVGIAARHGQAHDRGVRGRRRDRAHAAAPWRRPRPGLPPRPPGAARGAAGGPGRASVASRGCRSAAHLTSSSSASRPRASSTSSGSRARRRSISTSRCRSPRSTSCRSATSRAAPTWPTSTGG